MVDITEEKKPAKPSPPKRAFLVAQNVGTAPVRVEGIPNYWCNGDARSAEDMNMTEAQIRQIAKSVPKYFLIDEREVK